MFVSSRVVNEHRVLQPGVNVVRSNGTGSITQNYTLVDLQLLSDKKAATLVPAMVIVGVLILVGVVGNLLVCYIFCTRLKSNTQHFFILCLAVIDLVSCSVAMPAEIADMTYFYTFSSEAACKILRFIISMSTFSSVFTLMTIAIDRFRKICRPHGTQLTRRYARLSVILILALALLCSWPAPIIYGIASVDVGYAPITGQDCTVGDGVRDTVIPLVYNFVLLFGFLALTVVIVVMYSLILVGLRRHNKTMRAFKFDETSSSQIKPKTRLCRLSQMEALPPKAALPVTGHRRESKYETPINKILKTNSSNSNDDVKESFCCPVEKICQNGILHLDNKTSTKESPDRDNTTKITHQDDDSMAVSLNDVTISKKISTVPECLSDASEITSISKLTASRTQSQNSCSSADVLFIDEVSSCSFDKEFPYQPKTRSHEVLSPRISGASRSRNITSKTTTIAFVVTLVFIFSYLPHIILQVVKFSHDSPGQEGAGLVVFNLLIRSYFINSVTNPIIYGVLNVQFRKQVSLLMSSIFRCRRP